MSAATMSNYLIGFPKQSGKGFASESIVLEKKYEDILNQLKKTESIGRYSQLQQIIDELEEIFISCSRYNWDGYGANPISVNTFLDAKNIINMLNATFLNFPMPEITPEPDGDIAFEWSDDYGRTFVFSVDDNQTLTYAGIFGANSTHGTELLGDFIPDPIINYLKRLYSK